MVQASAILSPRWRHSRTRCGLLYLLTALLVGGERDYGIRERTLTSSMLLGAPQSK